MSTFLTGHGGCGQQNPQTGFLTKYVYNALEQITSVNQNAQTGGTIQSRSYSYDGLGRLTSETNPESGTTNYTYDSDSTCGTSKGDLVKKQDAVGNVTCMAYDALHRVTAIASHPDPMRLSPRRNTTSTTQLPSTASRWYSWQTGWRKPTHALVRALQDHR